MDQKPPSRGTTIGVGAIFAAIGIYIVMVGLGELPTPGKANAPMWVVILAGLCFLLGGLGVLIPAAVTGEGRWRAAGGRVLLAARVSVSAHPHDFFRLRHDRELCRFRTGHALVWRQRTLHLHERGLRDVWTYRLRRRRDHHVVVPDPVHRGRLAQARRSLGRGLVDAQPEPDRV